MPEMKPKTRPASLSVEIKTDSGAVIFVGSMLKRRTSTGKIGYFAGNATVLPGSNERLQVSVNATVAKSEALKDADLD